MRNIGVVPNPKLKKTNLKPSVPCTKPNKQYNSKKLNNTPEVE